MDSCRAWHEVAICSLAALHKGARGVVSAIAEGNGTTTIGDVAGSTIVRRLMELGFVPGERIEVIEGGHASGANLKERAHTTALEMTYFTRKLMD